MSDETPSVSRTRDGERRTVVTLASDHDGEAADGPGPARTRSRHRLRAVRVGVQMQTLDPAPRAPNAPTDIGLVREGDAAMLAGDVEDVTLVELGDGVMMGHRANGLRVGLVTPAWKPKRQILLIEGEDGVRVAAEDGLAAAGQDELVAEHALGADVRVSFEPETTSNRQRQRQRPRSGTRVTSHAVPTLGEEDAVRAERDRSWALAWVRRLFGEGRSRKRD